MKKIIILLLMLFFISCDNNEENQKIINGISWNMSKQEIKKNLSDKVLAAETENELVYRKVEMNVSEIYFREEMDLVDFYFKNNKLQIISGAIMRMNNNDNFQTLKKIQNECNHETNEKVNNYSCNLYESGSTLTLDIRYENPKYKGKN